MNFQSLPKEIQYGLFSIIALTSLCCLKRICNCCLTQRRHNQNIRAMRENTKAINMQNRQHIQLKTPQIIIKDIVTPTPTPTPASTPIHRPSNKIRQGLIDELVNIYLYRCQENNLNQLTVEEIYKEYNNFDSPQDIKKFKSAISYLNVMV